MLRFTLLLLPMLLSAATAAAQPTFRLGMRGGLNRASTTLDAASPSLSGFSYSADNSAIYSWQAGAVLEIALGKFALQPTLLFSQKGEQLSTGAYAIGERGASGTSTRSTTRYNWLELPVNLVYTVRGVQLFAGPYAALGLGGRQRGTSYSASPSAKFAPFHFNEKIRYGSDVHNPRLDAGVNFGIGYRQGPVQVQLGYQIGLVTLQRAHVEGIVADFPYHDFNADATKNRVLQLMGTYFLKL